MTAFLDPDAAAIPLELVTAAEAETLEEPAARASRFRGEAGKVVAVPAPDGSLAKVIAGLGSGEAWAAAALPGALPPGDYRITRLPPGLDLGVLAAAWADGAYRFTRYKSGEAPARLAAPEGLDRAEAEREADAINMVRDLVNTPASDMGPDEIAAAAEELAATYGARIAVTRGEALEEGFPMVHAVGKGADRPPCFIELQWSGTKAANAPRIVLVGKGVAFDTGGLNLKTGPNMGLMKKDMGGAAHVLGLGRLVMGARLPVDLTVIVPAVENAIGSRAFRPGDIYRTRKGLTVEIEDTDAEGRLILADALTRAGELKPDLLIDYATLTGAARVALGPDLAPLYTDDETLAEDILREARAVADPVWRMPLWDPYAAGLKSPIADLKNLGDGPMGGSITAALFLKAFVDRETVKAWAHFDVWAWRPARYGRPAGAAANGLRAVWAMLKRRYGMAEPRGR
jgi:leucyl aminopeptidase